MKLVAARFFAWGALPFLADQVHGLRRLQTALSRERTDLATKAESAVHADDYGAAVAIVQDLLIQKLFTATVDLSSKATAAAEHPNGAGAPNGLSTTFRNYGDVTGSCLSTDYADDTDGVRCTPAFGRLITRKPGRARSIEVVVPRNEVPPLD